jgi:arsenate reductase-like glutaredoxin family protein
MGAITQIFGRRDCAETRKTERWFKDRGKTVQFIDLKVKAMSKGELEAVARPIGWEPLLDREGKRFKNKGLAAMSPGRVQEVLLADSQLLRTPIIRRGAKAVLGYQPDVWSEWPE